MYQIRDHYLGGFESIARSETSVAEDKALILQSASAMFGSIAAADEYLRTMMSKVIGSHAVGR